MFKFWKKRTREREVTIQDVLGEAQTPSFPAAVMQILTEIRNPGNSMSEVAQQVANDPGLTIRVLQTVNSAAYGLGKTVTSILHASSLMGRSRLEALVLGAAIHHALPRKSAPGFDSGRFWKTACRRAGVARALGSFLHPRTQAEAFTAGLLQDMAIPLLAQSQTGLYGDVLERWHEECDSDLGHLELEAFGWTHAQMGGSLASTWQLPDYLVRAVQGHHDDHSAGVDPAVQLVSSIREVEDGCSIDALVTRCADDYGLDGRMVQKSIEDSIEKADEFSRLIA